MSEFQRVVCFTFRADASAEAIARHMDGFRALAGAIPEIRSYRGGRTVSAEADGALEFDAMHYLTFDSEAAIARYFVHDAHQAFIRDNRGTWERAIVVNGSID